ATIGHIKILNCDMDVWSIGLVEVIVKHVGKHTYAVPVKSTLNYLRLNYSCIAVLASYIKHQCPGSFSPAKAWEHLFGSQVFLDQFFSNARLEELSEPSPVLSHLPYCADISAAIDPLKHIASKVQQRFAIEEDKLSREAWPCLGVV